MRILQIHNKYQQAGGEDSVVRLEYEMLCFHKHSVEQIIFDNDSIKSIRDKVCLIFTLIFNFRSYRLIVKKIKHFKPDIVHVHNFFPIASPAVFYAARSMGIPVVFTLHNYRLVCANAELFRNGQPCFSCVKKKFPLDGILHNCYRNSKAGSFFVTLLSAAHRLLGTWKNKVDAYIVLSHYAKNLLVNSSLKLNPEKVFIKPNFYHPKKSSSLSGNPARTNRFLFVGRLVENKGISDLLHAVHTAGVSLDIIGDGPLKEMVMNFCTENQKVEYHGFRDTEYILKMMAKSKALIFPSVKIEGFPVTIIEAFSTATPVIAANVGPMEEFIKNNDNGLLYHSVNELSEQLIKIENNEIILDELYQKSHESYQKLYSQETNYHQLMAIYSSILKNG